MSADIMCRIMCAVLNSGVTAKIISLLIFYNYIKIASKIPDNLYDNILLLFLVIYLK